MKGINLLPWREQLREEKKRQFLTILIGAVIIAALIMIFIHVSFAKMIHAQKSHNRYIQQEVSKLDRKIRTINELKKHKAALLARMAIIQELQEERSQIVRLFDEIVNVLPKGVYLSKIERKNNLITLEGIAESNTNISQLMRRINNNVAALGHSVLSEIKTDNTSGRRKNEFKLELSLIKNTPVDGVE